MLLTNGSPALKKRIALLVNAIGQASVRGENTAKRVVKEQANHDPIIDEALDSLEPKTEKRVPLGRKLLRFGLGLLPLGNLVQS
jgi:hypothetical protein